MRYQYLYIDDKTYGSENDIFIILFVRPIVKS